MPTFINIQNNLTVDLAVSTTVAPTLSSKSWGVSAPSARRGERTRLLWMDRNLDVSDRHTWTFTSTVSVGGTTVLLQESLTGLLASSEIAVQIVAGSRISGWHSRNAALTVTAADGNTYRIGAAFVRDGVYDDVTYGVTLVAAQRILPKIEHIVVLMAENRSLDNLLGWVYANGASPSQFLPLGSGAAFDGLAADTYANSDPAVDGGRPVYAGEGTSSWSEGSKTVSEWFVPSPDPGEEFEHITAQVFNGGADADMSGFLSDYVRQTAAKAPAASAAQIMQTYSPAQLPIINTLAQSFAVSDAWFCSVPSQTWPNRGFAQTGSSDGHTNNNYVPPWDINTVFDVLGAQDLSWAVYNDGALPSLTKAMFLTKYIFNRRNFLGIEEFRSACAQPADAPLNQKLPSFSFVEPNFGIMGTDDSYHPPHDVRSGERFLAGIYDAIAASPYRDDILFIVLFDEHGGTYDHVAPPAGAQPPSPHPVATDGSGFGFDRFGVRVPAIVISSWVQPGTVFRSDTKVPLDHTSVLATVRDWLGLSPEYSTMLPSPRIAAAPHLGFVLTETTPQPWPSLPGASTEVIAEAADEVPLNDIHRAVLVAAAGIAARVHLTDDEARAAHGRLQTHGDGRAFLMALQPHLPLK